MTKYINIRMGLIGGLFMGLIVFFINKDAGLMMALIASLKQASYTFLFGGIVIRLCENLSLRFTRLLSLTVATLVPATIAILATYAVHQFRGTPKPIDSTIPTIILSVPGFLFISLRKRSAQKNISIT